MKNRVQDLVRAVGNMARGKQVAVGFMVVLIVLTWLAVCAVLASLLAG
jgi:hypothetical protein